VDAGFEAERGRVEASTGAGAMTPAELDELIARGAPMLVDFHTEWCAPCRKMAPVVDALAEAWRGKVEVLRVDIDRSEALAARERIQGVPVFVLYNGGEERWRHSGETSRQALDEQLKLASAPD
jgi:thioredoxin 1